MITNIKLDGFEYEWNIPKTRSYNLGKFIQKYSAKKLAEYFLKTKTLRWEGNGYIEVLGTGNMLDEILMYHFDELGESLWVNVLSNAIIWQRLEAGFEEKIMNLVFRHKSINIDPYILMNNIAPLISKKDVYKRDHTDNMEMNHEMALPYFMALNDKITKAKAEEIFEDFNEDGLTFLGIPAQNWLIDNNKHIQKIIDNLDLSKNFPPKAARDIFLF